MSEATYALRGATLALAWFFVVNAAASIVVAALARRARGSSSLFLALRLLPACVSVAFVAGVFLPSYVRFEPRGFAEGFDLSISLLAGAAGALVAAAGGRAALAWVRGVRRTRSWIREAEPMALPGLAIPAFRVNAPHPMMALVGIVRSRLLVTRGLIDALTPEELAASVAHELGHHRSWDNGKRLAMRAAPDVLGWFAAARTLEHRWAACAERSADEGASPDGDRTARLALASALVKVARLMPPPPAIGEPISTLVGGGEIAARVERLIDDGARVDRPRGRFHRLAIIAGVGVTVGLGYAPLLKAVHLATELLVHHLP